jgi:hypothetical protein
VVIDQELTSLELVRVHDVQQYTLATGFSKVLSVEFGRHGTPDFGALEWLNELYLKAAQACLPVRLQCVLALTSPSSLPHIALDR